VPAVAEPTVRRLSRYLQAVEDALRSGDRTVSSGDLARLADTTAAQVRKDLSQFGSFGTRGVGYDARMLRDQLRNILGLKRAWQVVIVGAGKIGAALAQYPGFAEHGFHVAAVFDCDPAKVGNRWGRLTVCDVTELEARLRTVRPDIAVLAVPSPAAQGILDRLADAGVRAVLNFASAPLRPPPGVEVRHVNMAHELEALSFSLTRQG
jgi:redox-sensing transcriptional repressor